MRHLSLVALVGSSAAVVVMTGAGASLAGASIRAAPRATASCSGAATISHFAFNPIKIVEGRTATLHIAITNCSATSAFSGALMTYGFLCAAVDPISTPVTVAAGSTRRFTQTYAFTSCAGKGHITGRLSLKSKVVSTRTAYIATIPLPG